MLLARKVYEHDTVDHVHRLLDRMGVQRRALALLHDVREQQVGTFGLLRRGQPVMNAAAVEPPLLGVSGEPDDGRRDGAPARARRTRRR